MIYQHRAMICRRGKLQKRTELFEKTRLENFESAGPPLIGSFETITGQDAFSICWQYRQFKNIEEWAAQQEFVSTNKPNPPTGKTSNISEYVDEVDTYLIQLNSKCPPIRTDWEKFSSINKDIKGVFIQNIYRFQLSELEEAISGYFDIIYPRYDYHGVDHIGLFGTIIGSGSVNRRSLRQVELIRFEDLSVWEDWRNALKVDPVYKKSSKELWFSKVASLDSVIMEPTDFSRIR